MSYWFYWGGYIVPVASYVYPYGSKQYETAKMKDYGLFKKSGQGKKDAKDQRGFNY